MHESMTGYFRITLSLIILLFCLIYYNLLLGKEIFTHDSIIWCGRFLYYLESLINGYFPFWNPYIIAGTPFYPNISSVCLDPLILLYMFFVKGLSITPLTTFIYFFLFKLAIFVIGAFYLFKHITGCRMSALVASGILLFSIAPTAFRQIGVLDFSFLSPFTLYLTLLLFDNLNNHKRYFYLPCLVLVASVSMNILVPGYFLFNLFTFLITTFAIRIVNLDEIKSALPDKKLLAFLFFSVVLLTVMMAPLLVLYQDSKGELFPSVRIIQKNGYFKKLMASEVDGSVLSEKFTKQLGVYNSYGNALNLIYPDMYKSFFDRKDSFRSSKCYIAETFQYIGMIPFIFCVIGFIYSKSRYRYLALIMLVLIFINMFSFDSIVARPNPIQEVFHTIFPPLKMIDVKEVFSSFFLLYLAMLLSLGMKVFFDEKEWLDLIKRKYIHIITICLVILLLKFIVTGYFWGKLFFTTRLDLFAVASLLFFIILIYQYSRALVQERLLYGLILFLMFADIAYYNIQIKPYVLQKNTLGQILAEQQRMNVNQGFEYFRIPFLETSVAFGETIFKVKGAISRGNNHHFFTTKRYYDYLTHVPLENQFILSGCVYPILRFFPNDKVKVFEDKKGLLNYFAEADDPWTLGQYLHVEKGGEGADHIEQKGIQSLDQSEDVLWLRKDHVTAAYAKFLDREEKRLKEIRENLDQYLDTPEYKLSVKKFSPNEIVISVNNDIDGYLYYNDGWSKYWKAYDGDIEVPIKIANYNFKAVFLEEGGHVIRFVYNPGHYKLGLIAYYIGTLFCLFFIAFFVRDPLTIFYRH